MKARILVLTVLFLTAAQGMALAATKAKAILINAKGEKTGEASFKEVKEGVEVSLKVWGLSPGVHATHIHEEGVCAPPDFKSAKGHFNPELKKHGKDNPEGYHAGDLPNIAVAGNGKGSVNFVTPDLSFKGDNSILKKGGTAVIVHAGPDDNVTDPAGNAGDRVACGIIKA